MKRHTRTFAAAAIAALVLAGCSGDDTAGDTTTDTTGDATTDGDAAPAEPAPLAVTATDAGDGTGYAFEAPAVVTAGTYEVQLTNTGAEGHHAQLYRLNDDKTLADLAAAAEAENPEAALFEIGIVAGGTGPTDPGASSSANGYAELNPGQYVWMCFMPSPDGTAHVEQGMALPFSVTSSDEPAAQVEADASVRLIDFSFELPGSLEAGSVLEIENASASEFHEANLFQLGEGKTIEDMMAFFADPAAAGGPPPFSSVGGMQGLMPGASAKLNFTVDAGTYVFICFIPTPGSDFQPHFTKGMVAQVQVT